LRKPALPECRPGSGAASRNTGASSRQRSTANGQLELAYPILEGTNTLNIISLDRITFDPRVMCARACIRRMRLTVSLIANLVADGMTPAEIIKEYPKTSDRRCPTLLGLRLKRFALSRSPRALVPSIRQHEFERLGLKEARECAHFRRTNEYISCITASMFVSSGERKRSWHSSVAGSIPDRAMQLAISKRRPRKRAIP
jgi:uncharacterized protein (DUF433 family)